MKYFRPLQLLCVLFLICCGVTLDRGPARAQDTIVPPDPIGGDQTITIKMESYTFTPKTLTAELGKPLKFLLMNESFLVPHNFLLDSPDGIRLIEQNVDSGEQATIQFTPTQKGVYVFYCDKQLLFFPNHREEGMEGSLTVH
ncbi:MAG: cupredoxin domain-containing protein [Nitrospirales bacterium]